MPIDYDEAWKRLEELTETPEYQEFVDEVSGLDATVQPAVQVIGDRAIVYLQTEGREGYSRKVIGEYRESNGELGPVPATEEELERVLDGAGEVEIREELLEPRDINFSGQRHHVRR